MTAENSTPELQNLSPQPNSPQSGVVWRRLGPILSLFLGAILGILFWAIRHRDTTPPLTEATFAAARDRWQQANIQNYTVTIQVTGNQPATYKVWIEGGLATKAERNGNPLQQRRTFETWSVPGMFGTIERDVSEIAAASAGPHLVLRAEFDPETGVPLRYRRLAYRGGGDVQWQVTAFEKQ